MSTRERWTVYPLLFLALGAALRPKLTSTLDVRNISCEELIVASHDGKSQIHLNRSLQLLAGGDKPLLVLGVDHNAGKLETFNDRGQPQVVLQSSKRGGSITTADWDHKLFITMGHEDTRSGIFAFDPKQGLSAALFARPSGEPTPKLTPPKTAPPPKSNEGPAGRSGAAPAQAPSTRSALPK